jgi:hypothetical protein
MLLYFIAVPVAFLVAQGFWTLIAYIVTWCGFPKAGAVVFWAPSPSHPSARSPPSHGLNLIAA